MSNRQYRDSAIGMCACHAAGQGKAGDQQRLGVVEMAAGESGRVTGTKDKDYNLLWLTEKCLNNALRLETYIEDADRDGDTEVAEFFRKAQADSRKGAEQGKQLLRKRLSG